MLITAISRSSNGLEERRVELSFVRGTLWALLGPGIHHILKSRNLDGPAESFRAQKFCGSWACEIWGFPDTDNLLASEVTQWASAVVPHKKQEFSSDSNSILRRVETRIMWGLGGSMWNPQRCRKHGICWASDQVQELVEVELHCCYHLQRWPMS